ncbi:MAG: ATP-dependent zinc metalloprotease FtsH [Anaerolineae bacterium]|nr:ATP-dependent zinc metalloprotease FtsH [Anaerolineae bacterium]
MSNKISANSASRIWLILGIVVSLLLVFAFASPPNVARNRISLNEFADHIRDREVSRITVRGGSDIVIDLINGQSVNYFNGSNQSILEVLQLVGVTEQQLNNFRYIEMPGGIDFGSSIIQIITALGPTIILGWLFWRLFRSARSDQQRALDFGRKITERLNEPDHPTITFSDIAGQESAKEELRQIVDFLKSPHKYQELGARIPKGVLLVGPPGTGKTLMARAVAGEAGVAFYSIVGSEFIELFVGVGASRVRELFKKAKENSPSIIFIDELDAVGRQRATVTGGGNDEREQTLNQLLAEMDGFATNSSVIVLAATNRREVLDQALLRPGRFDRHVTVSLPDRLGRLGILRLHIRDKKVSGVDLDRLSKATIGFSGADLENLTNEAALIAASKGSNSISMPDFEDALVRIRFGNESPPLADEEERKFLAYRIAANIAMTAWVANAYPVNRIDIVPRAHSLSTNFVLEGSERKHRTRKFLMKEMAIMLAGCAAEVLEFGDITTGSAEDLGRASNLARQMVTEFGMSNVFGIYSFAKSKPQDSSKQSESLYQGSVDVPDVFSSDDEVRAIVSEAYDVAFSMLKRNRVKFHRLAEELLENEVLDRDQVIRILS